MVVVVAAVASIIESMSRRSRSFLCLLLHTAVFTELTNLSVLLFICVASSCRESTGIPSQVDAVLRAA